MSFRDELLKNKEFLIEQANKQEEKKQIALLEESHAEVNRIINFFKNNVIQSITNKKVNNKGLIFKKEYIPVRYNTDYFPGIGKPPVWYSYPQFDEFISKLLKEEGFSEVKISRHFDNDYRPCHEYSITATMYL